MPPSFTDSGRYASVHESPNGPGDARPTAAQIVQDNDLIGKWQDKVILLTGGSSGLGIDEVRTLAMTGARVIFTSRNVEKGEKVKADILKQADDEGSPKPRVEVLKMDLQSLQSVRQAAEELKSMTGQLNILINNAGQYENDSGGE